MIEGEIRRFEVTPQPVEGFAQGHRGQLTGTIDTRSPLSLRVTP